MFLEGDQSPSDLILYHLRFLRKLAPGFEAEVKNITKNYLKYKKDFSCCNGNANIHFSDKEA